MTLQKLKKFVFISSIAAGGFITGNYYERRLSESSLTLNFKNYPGLPVFGTVSAATPVAPVPHVPTQSNLKRISEVMKYGFPSLDSLRSFDNFVLSYDKRNRVANWVFEHITSEIIKPAPGVDRSLSEFTPDESIHPYFRSENSDYYRSGYDRGHLAAAGNHQYDQKSMNQTFYLSNIAPQVGEGFNRDSWVRLEKYVRRLTRKNANVYVCTGPLYLPRKEANGKNYVKYEVIGAKHVAVPTHFFKVVVCETKEGELEMESYVMPNEAISDDIPLTNFLVPPETIERAAGLLFFDNISRSKLSKINGKKT